MNKKTANILIIILAVITAVGIALGFWLYTSQDKYINEKTIVLGENTQTKMEVNLGSISPGTNASYKLHLRANKGEAFQATLEFKDKTVSSLAKFLDVEIKLNGEKIDTAGLSEYFNGKQSLFPLAFQGTNNAELEIIYSMGIEVGDEAQNATADFDMILSVQR